MSDPFVPYVTEPARSKAGAAPFRVMVISQPEATAPAFAPLQPASPGAAPGSASPALRSHPHPPHPGGPEPQVTLDRDGDRITRISIRCACGQVIQLDCSY